MPSPFVSSILQAAVDDYGSPVYVYLVDEMHERCALLRRLFGDRLSLSYAVKANPNIDLIRSLLPSLDCFDISSIAEARWVQEAGGQLSYCSFTGPAKRTFELEHAVQWGVGQIVCESADEMLELNQICEARSASVEILIRINPSEVPKGFGVQMARKPSQFGVDEDKLDNLAEILPRCPNLNLVGWHIYSGTNSLSAGAIIENFTIMAQRFTRYSEQFDLQPKTLIFGAGFGIPYLPSERELDIESVAAGVNPVLDGLRNIPRFANSEFQLELGRWIVGPCGYLVARVVGLKTSRGSEIALCDAGFNNHLSACGMMGSVMRRNWNIFKVDGTPSDDPPGLYRLVGPLCTTIDQLAADIELPRLSKGDLLAVPASGAYGYTASPTRFISHPPPAEVLFRDGSLRPTQDQWAQFNWQQVVQDAG